MLAPTQHTMLRHPPAYNQPQGQGDERGLGSTLIGGAGGAYVGHQMGGGALATAGGAVIGAIGANAVTHGVTHPRDILLKDIPSRVTPPQGYPQGYPPQGYPPQGYPPQGYPQGPYQQPMTGTTTTTTTTTTTDDGSSGGGGLLGLGRGRGSCCNNGGGLLGLGGRREGGGILGRGPLGFLADRRDYFDRRRDRD
ncbi:uncharacterized protein N7483_001502 [Penicillium malachiteum]|uniref:uncharacterized protein n=1 Tax=Penicillium malachiteum TaxID=1324776 RepID=UPI0025467DAE|nr:uncharacterized protein N7483_001502 [Penicillium malachiteum]KAJ5736377.1 hypothetical protein N7483_001502 [Penicillium malachiteum]